MKNTVLNTLFRFSFFLLLSIVIITGGALNAKATSHSPLSSPDKIHYAPLQFSLPQTQRVVLENGIVLHILKNHELPVVNIQALVKTGTMYDPEGKAGVAELTAYVMRTGGTAKLNSDEIDSRLDFMAASASIGMSLDSAQVNFSVLNENLDKGLELLAQILIEPAFEQEKFELARQLKNEELRRLKDDPQKFAFREFNRLIYTHDPRGNFFTSKSLANIVPNDLIEFHSRFFRPNNIIFAVSGDITKEEATRIFNRYFGGWKANNIANDIPPPSQTQNAGVYCINKEITQSTIVSGQYTVSKKDPAFYALTVFDFIVGSGGFSSRIVSVVRSNEGLAYTAGSFYRPRPQYGIFGNYAFTKTSSTMKTLSLLNSVLEDIKSNPITAKEMDWAKKSINNGFVFSFDTPEQIATQQMNIEYEQLPADYLTNYRNNIEKVTIEDVSNVTIKYIDKAKNVVLILGDSKKFDDPFSTQRCIFITPEE
jgi:zinc protease